MNVLVIPDIHLKHKLFDHAEKILKEGKADLAVCLMDMPDDWGQELHVERYKATFQRAIAFEKEHPETLWCYGNHEISYLWGKLETGYSVYAESTVLEGMNRLQASLPSPKHMAIIHRIDRVLFSHGGLAARYVTSLQRNLQGAHIDQVLAAVNNAKREQLWVNDSPLWLRPQLSKGIKMYKKGEFIQVVGHTPVKTIEEKNGIISTDVFSTNREGIQIGESAMIVINTKTGEYEKNHCK